MRPGGNLPTRPAPSLTGYGIPFTGLADGCIFPGFGIRLRQTKRRAYCLRSKTTPIGKANLCMCQVRWPIRAWQQALISVRAICLSEPVHRRKTTRETDIQNFAGAIEFNAAILGRNVNRQINGRMDGRNRERKECAAWARPQY
jgi:hypothetical protein